MKFLTILLLIGSVVAALAALFVYSGVFDVAADVPHSALVYGLMETVRERSIAMRVKSIAVPVLDDPQLVTQGARHYADMCTDCHLAPGVKQSAMRDGLYPQPPNFTEHIHAKPAEMFWVIKHGLKMSAMPAWGKTHDDQSIWGLVAFLQKLPELTPDQYQILVNTSGQSDHPPHRHHHHGPEDTGHSHP